MLRDSTPGKKIKSRMKASLQKKNACKSVRQNNVKINLNGKQLINNKSIKPQTRWKKLSMYI